MWVLPGDYQSVPTVCRSKEQLNVAVMGIDVAAWEGDFTQVEPQGNDLIVHRLIEDNASQASSVRSQCRTVQLYTLL